MSPIGRIFIVLNLILSAAFLGWAANALGTTKELKKELADAQTAHATALAAKDDELAKLDVDLKDVTEQQRTMREERDGIRAEADRLKTQVEELKRSGETMQANLTKIQATLGDYNNSITQLTQQKDAAVERAHEAERARDTAMSEKQAAELAMSTAEEATNNANLSIGDLEKVKTDLMAQVDSLETQIAAIVERTGINVKDFVAQKPIDAQVLQVNRDLKFVVINKGRADEVKPGYTFDIYRGSTYKGQVRIQDVQENMSSGQIVVEKNAIATGDSATTTL
jgi:septal ring factor EnvC (AmiA/AmiB activator)